MAWSTSKATSASAAMIPTDMQMTVVSAGTVYIEGSITKGLVGNDITAFTGQAAVERVLRSPSQSMLMLMAKEPVAVNTTQFFGAAAGQALDVKDGDTTSAVRVAAQGGGSVSLRLSLS